MASVVTGISPKEGKPGTRLTIRGENFGGSPADLVAVFVCGTNCVYSAEWHSKAKITCRIPLECTGRGDVIVATKAGRGSCNVQFTALKPQPVGALEESNVWIDEAPGVGYSFIRAERGSVKANQQDPLGLKKIAEKPTLVEHRRLFLGQSPDPSHENFSPVWFLLHHHKSTSFADLRKGLSNLQRSSTGSGVVSQPTSAQSASFQHIKDSLPVFFEVHEALSSIHGQMDKHSTGRAQHGITDNLEQLLIKAEHDSAAVFEDVLTHKEKADKIRNSLAVLQRFKLLFHLPGRVHRCRESGDSESFSQVVSDVEKVRSLFKSTNVKVFKIVMDELETAVMELQKSLHSQLFDGKNMAQQHQIVRQLIELGASGDPTWDALKTSFQTMRRRNIEFLNTAKEKWNSDSIAERRDLVTAFVDSVLGQFKALLTDLWKLWTQYSTGTLLHNDPQQSAKLKQLAIQHSKEVKRLFSDEILYGVSLIRAAVLPETLKAQSALEATERKEYGIWPEKIRSVVSVANLNKILRSARGIDAGEIFGSDQIKELAFDLRVKTLRLLMEELLEEIKGLAHQEDWELCADGGTKLPQKFISGVNEFCLLAKDVVKVQPAEENIFDRIQVEAELRGLMASILCQFPATLSSLALKEATEAETRHWPDAAVRLVTVLSNSIHSRTTKMIQIEKSLAQLGFPDSKKLCTTVQKKFSELDNRLMEGYLETRRDPIVCALEPGMYAGYFDWATCARPNQVRPYVKLCLIEVVAVHAELHSVSHKLLVSVLPKVIDGLGEEFVRLLSSVSKFSANGGLQARIEIMAIRECTALYNSPRSQQLFDGALELLPDPLNEDLSLMEEILTKFRKDMMMQLMALKESA